MILPNNAHAGVPEDLVELGRVVSAYGVRGWIKIQPHSAQSEVLLSTPRWWLKAPVPIGSPGASSRVLQVQVLACRRQGATIVAQLDSVLDRDQAEGLKAYTILVPRSVFPSISDDEYYWIDLIDCRLFGDHDGVPALIGTVVEVVDNGAHAVLRVARASHDEQGNVIPLLNDKGKSLEVLVPFVHAHVHTVDLVNKRLDSNWPAEF